MIHSKKAKRYIYEYFACDIEDSCNARHKLVCAFARCFRKRMSRICDPRNLKNYLSSEPCLTQEFLSPTSELTLIPRGNHCPHSIIPLKRFLCLIAHDCDLLFSKRNCPWQGTQSIAGDIERKQFPELHGHLTVKVAIQSLRQCD